MTLLLTGRIEKRGYSENLSVLDDLRFWALASARQSIRDDGQQRTCVHYQESPKGRNCRKSSQARSGMMIVPAASVRAAVANGRLGLPPTSHAVLSSTRVISEYKKVQLHRIENEACHVSKGQAQLRLTPLDSFYLKKCSHNVNVCLEFTSQTS